MALTELERYETVNACETADDLSKAILSMADANGMIQGRSRSFVASKMAGYPAAVIAGECTPNVLTRMYGIRQQALYIKHCIGK